MEVHDHMYTRKDVTTALDPISSFFWYWRLILVRGRLILEDSEFAYEMKNSLTGADYDMSDKKFVKSTF